MSGHLGRRVSALVDDRLPADERERALSHLVRCPQCRAAVESERRAKSTLGALPGPDVPPALLSRLLEAGTPSGPPPRDRASVPTAPARGPASSDATRRPRGGAPAGRPGVLRRVQRRPVQVALAAVTVAGASLGFAFVSGGATPITPTAPAEVPALTRLTVRPAQGSTIGPFPDPATVATVLRSSPSPSASASPAPSVGSAILGR